MIDGAAGKLLEVDCCDRALRGVSKGSVRSHVEFPAVDCCDGAFRDVSKGSVGSSHQKPEYDCCNRALRGVPKGSVWSRGKLVVVDCCDRALRGVSKGSVGSHRKKNSRMSYRHRKKCYLPLAIRISICYSHNRTKDTIAVRT